MVDGLAPNLAFYPVAALATLTAALVTLVIAVNAWRRSNDDKNNSIRNGHETKEPEESKLSTHQDERDSNENLEETGNCQRLQNKKNIIKNTTKDSSCEQDEKRGLQTVLNGLTSDKQPFKNYKGRETRSVLIERENKQAIIDKSAEKNEDINRNEEAKIIFVSDYYGLCFLEKEYVANKETEELKKLEENAIVFVNDYFTGKNEVVIFGAADCNSSKVITTAENDSNKISVNAKTNIENKLNRTKLHSDVTSKLDRIFNGNQIKVIHRKPSTGNLSPSHMLCTCAKYRTKQVDYPISNIGQGSPELQSNELETDEILTQNLFASSPSAELNISINAQFKESENSMSLEHSNSEKENNKYIPSDHFDQPNLIEPDVICENKSVSNTISGDQFIPDVLKFTNDTSAAKNVSDMMFFNFDTKKVDYEKHKLLEDEKLHYTRKSYEDMLSSLYAKFRMTSLDSGTPAKEGKYEEICETDSETLLEDGSVSNQLNKRQFPCGKENCQNDLRSSEQPEIRIGGGSSEAKTEEEHFELKSSQRMHKSAVCASARGKQSIEKEGFPLSKRNNGGYEGSSCLPPHVTSGEDVERYFGKASDEGQGSSGEIGIGEGEAKELPMISPPSPACNAEKSTTPTRMQMEADSSNSCTLHDQVGPPSDHVGRFDQLPVDLETFSEGGVPLESRGVDETSINKRVQNNLYPTSTWPSTSVQNTKINKTSSNFEIQLTPNQGGESQDLKAIEIGNKLSENNSVGDSDRDIFNFYETISECTNNELEVDETANYCERDNTLISAASEVIICDENLDNFEDSGVEESSSGMASPTRQRLLRLLERDQERKSRVIDFSEAHNVINGVKLKSKEYAEHSKGRIHALESSTVGNVKQVMSKEETFTSHDAVIEIRENEQYHNEAGLKKMIEIAEVLEQGPNVVVKEDIRMDCTNKETNNLCSEYSERNKQQVKYLSDTNQEGATTINANIIRRTEAGGVKSHEISTGISVKVIENRDVNQLRRRGESILSENNFEDVSTFADNFTSFQTKVSDNEVTVTTEVVDRWRPKPIRSALRERPTDSNGKDRSVLSLKLNSTKNTRERKEAFSLDQNADIDNFVKGDNLSPLELMRTDDDKTAKGVTVEGRCAASRSGDFASQGGRAKKSLRFSDELNQVGTGGPEMEEVSPPKHETANAATNTTTPTKIKNLRFKLDPDVYDLPSENGYYDDDDYNRRPGWRKQPRYNTFSALDIGREPVKVVSVRTSVVPAGHKMVVKPVCVSEGHRPSQDGVEDSRVTVKHLDIDLRIRLETENKNSQKHEPDDWQASPNKKAFLSSSPAQGKKRSPAPDFWNQSLSPVSETCDWMTNCLDEENGSFRSDAREQEEESGGDDETSFIEKSVDRGDQKNNADKNAVISENPFQNANGSFAPYKPVPPPRPSSLPLNHFRKHLQLPRKKFVPDPEAVERITGFKAAEEKSMSKPPLPPTVQSLTSRRYNSGAKGRIDQLRKKYLDSKSLMSAAKADSGAKFEQFMSNAQRERANLVTSAPDLAEFEAAVRAQWSKAKRGATKDLSKENTPPPNSSDYGTSDTITRSSTPDDVWLSYVQRLRSQLNRRSQSMSYLETDIDAFFAEDKSCSMLTLDTSPPESTQSLIVPSSKNLNRISVNLEESGRTKSEHELRIEKSLQAMNVPEWYKHSRRPKTGFLLEKKPQEKRGWAAAKSLTSSTSSLASTGLRSRPAARSLRTSHENLWSRGSASPASADNSYSRWGRMHSGPSLSLALAKAFREPYVGWRARTPSSCASPSPQVDNSPPSWAVMDNTDCSDTPLTSDLQVMDEEEDTGISFDGEDVLEDADSSREMPHKIELSQPPSANDTCEDVINISMDTCDIICRQESRSSHLHGEDTCDDIKNISMDTFELCPPEHKEDLQASPAGGDSTCDDVLNISTDTSSHLAVNGTVGTSSMVGTLEDTADDIDNISTDTSNYVLAPTAPSQQCITNGDSYNSSDSMVVKSMPNLSDKLNTKENCDTKLDPKRKRYSYNKSMYHNDLDCAKQKKCQTIDGGLTKSTSNNKVIWIESSFVGSRTTTSIIVLPTAAKDVSCKGSNGSSQSVGRPASR